ncbi:MAG: hypothetical protein A2W19_15240 [Spirochaetes bacterium RBG_16_49_21]|nr:MAG: hypothetical protein A2W19_15240 [Spirochaetes bacterium RBG_16_49_21]
MKTTREKKSDQSIEIAQSNNNSTLTRECFQNQKIQTDRFQSIVTVESISRYYNILGNSRENGTDIELNGCFAVRLALLLIDVISKGRFPVTKSGCFKKKFYNQCMNKASEDQLLDTIDDHELFIIYTKQCLHLLRLSGILRQSGGYAMISDAGISGNSVYFRLFTAFWDKADWEIIFPSDVDSARELKINRNILKDLILKNYGKTRLDRVANEFFDMTGFACCNDLIMISFLDFYFFTWLKHFNMILYTDGTAHAPVCIAVTDVGRKILNLVL